MNFANTHMLWFLLVFPPGLVAFFWWSWRKRQWLMTQFIDSRLLPGLIFGVSPARQKIRFACLIGAVASVIIALARPQWGATWEQAKQKGLDIIVAIDTSKSMLAEDIAPNRLARAKLAALDLMKIAKSDRLGLVAFAGSAFLQCPLTIDDNAFRQSVEALDVNIIPQGGTALAEAINTALTAFKEGDNYKVLVLFTDGEDNDEGARAAAEAGAKEGMKIFTVGIGTPDGEILRIRDAKGRTDYIRNAEGQVVKSRLNEEMLKAIAEPAGGFYLPLRGAKTIDALYERGLAPLPKTEGQEKLVRRYNERYHWPLAAAIMLLLIEMILPESRPLRRKSPGPTGGAAEPLLAEDEKRPAVLSGVATVLVLYMLLGGVGQAMASPSSALRDYQAGKFEEAQKEYERVLQKKQDDPRLHFNAGAAAYRDGKLDEALKHFGEALPAQDLHLQEQAYYNLGNTMYRAGEAIPDQQKKQESWEGALKQYDYAMRLNTNNADAKFNRDFVKRKLEELKQQQQQNKQDKKDDKDNKDNKDDQNKQDQKQDQQKDQSKQDEKKDQEQAKNDQQKQDEKKSQDQSGKKDEEKKPDPKEGKSPDDKSKEQPEEKPEPGEPQPVAGRAMTPQEAKQLLDAQKGSEKVLPFMPAAEPKRRDRKLNDW